MKFGFLVKEYDSYSRGIANQIIEYFEEENHFVKEFERNEIIKDVDIVVVCGGDGTILGAANYCGEIPIFGINTGTLGFLSSDVDTEAIYPEMETVLNRIVKKDYQIDVRNRLLAKIIRQDKEIHSFTALNDIVIKGAAAKLIKLKVYIENRFVGNFPGDGLIISSATGSTAYNSSAGGPIIEPGVPANVITPICPHVLGVRPLVVFDVQPIRVIVDSYHKQLIASADGQYDFDLCVDDEVVICSSRTEITKFIQFNDPLNFFDNLRKKLKWGRE